MAKRNKYDNKGDGIDTSKSNINWYPGHMVKAINDIKSVLKLIDIVVEILPVTKVSNNIYILIVIVYIPSSTGDNILDKYILNIKPIVLVIIVNMVKRLMAFIICIFSSCNNRYWCLLFWRKLRQTQISRSC